MLRQTQTESESRAKARAGRVTVLLAEDDELFRGLVAEQLTDHGYDVIEVADGVEAIEALASAADGGRDVPDVVVLDVCMPECSGLGVLHVMRRLGARPPTVLMTGFRDRSVDMLATNLGAVRVLHKPFDPGDVLSAVLDAALAARRRPR